MDDIDILLGGGWGLGGASLLRHPQSPPRRLVKATLKMYGGDVRPMNSERAKILRVGLYTLAQYITQSSSSTPKGSLSSRADCICSNNMTALMPFLLKLIDLLV